MLALGDPRRCSDDFGGLRKWGVWIWVAPGVDNDGAVGVGCVSGGSGEFPWR